MAWSNLIITTTTITTKATTSSNSLSVIVIALICVSVLVVIILAIVFYICYRKKNNKEILPIFCAKLFLKYKLKDVKTDKNRPKGPTETVDVFLSYCHQDKQKAFQLVDLLIKVFKLKVWIDKYNIKPGIDYALQIQNGIKSAKCLVCLISKKYIDSENCVNEIKLGKYNKKRLFFVMFDSVKLEDSSIGYYAVGIQRFNLYKNINSLNFTMGAEFQNFLRELLKEIQSSANKDQQTGENSNESNKPSEEVKKPSFPQRKFGPYLYHNYMSNKTFQKT